MGDRSNDDKEDGLVDIDITTTIATGSYDNLVQYLLKGQTNKSTTTTATNSMYSNLSLTQLVSVQQSLLDFCGSGDGNDVANPSWNEVDQKKKEHEAVSNDSSSSAQRQLSKTIQTLWCCDSNGSSGASNPTSLAKIALAVLSKQPGDDENDGDYNHDDLDRKRLWVIQYMLHRIRTADHANRTINSLRGLRYLVVPYLLLLQTHGTDDDDEEQDESDNNKEDDIAPPSANLSTALFELVETSTASSTIDGNDSSDPGDAVSTVYWKEILAVLVESQHPNASMLLVKLLRLSNDLEDNGNSVPVSGLSLDDTLTGFYDKLWRHIQQGVDEGNGSSATARGGGGGMGRDWQKEHPLLASLSKHLLLPYMTMIVQMNVQKDDSSGSKNPKTKTKDTSAPKAAMVEPHRSHAVRLWHQLLTWIQQDQNALEVLTWKEQQERLQTMSSTSFRAQQEQQQTALLVATTVLCPLIPYLIPTGSPVDPALLADVNAPPLDTLWQLIYACLSQGRWAARESSTASSRSTNSSGMASMLRRRALYLLDVVASSGNCRDTALWKDYVMCFEMFELEGERHIVDQVWPVIVKLIESTCQYLEPNVPSSPGMVSPEWIETLIGRLLCSENSSIAKLGMFRLLQVLGREITSDDQDKANQLIQASVAVAKEQLEAVRSNAEVDSNAAIGASKSSKQSKKNKKKLQKDQTKIPKKAGGQNSKKDKKSLEEIPTFLLIRLLSIDTFLWDVLVPAFDNLSSAGYTLHFEEKGQALTPSRTAKHPVKANMIPMFEATMQSYAAFGSIEHHVKSFWEGLWNWDRMLGVVSTKTALLVFKASCDLLDDQSPNLRRTPKVLLSNQDFQSIHASLSNIVRDPSIVLTYRKELVNSLAKILASSSGSGSGWNPMEMLYILTLYHPDFFTLDSENWSIEEEGTLVALCTWTKMVDLQNSQQPNYCAATGAALASAFVAGQLKPHGSTEDTDSLQVWDPSQGYSDAVRDLGWAVTLFCCLSVQATSTSSTASLLWPAVHKGLGTTSAAILGKDQTKINAVARSVLLLEYGCKLRVLSGLGHGDLVVDPNTQHIMPPPPNIENILQCMSDFLQWQIRTMLCLENNNAAGASSTRSDGARRLASSYASLIAQLRTFRQSYPSSIALTNAMDSVLGSSTKELNEQQEDPDSSDDIQTIMLMGLIYAALSSFALPGEVGCLRLCRLVMSISLNGKASSASKSWKQSARSMLQFSKWGSCSCLIPLILKDIDDATKEDKTTIKLFIEEILNEGINSVSMTPSDALRPLFDCIVMTSRHWCNTTALSGDLQSQVSYIQTLKKTVSALLALLEESTVSSQSAYFLNEMCSLLFRANFMKEEFDRLQQNSTCDTPIRDAFRKLVKMAGTKRPHVSRALLCQAAVGWIGTTDELDDNVKGLNAIPYRDDIVKLLLHKEDRQEESSANQSKNDVPTSGVVQIPPDTNETSISRTFIFCFLESLPDPEKGLNKMVLTELLHHVILSLLDSTTQEKSSGPAVVMIGTATYCCTMRAWQALVLMSRFVTAEIASKVCEVVFQKTLHQQLHSQIRYFVELFTVQCAMRHSELFGQAFVAAISRTDLSLHHVSSLMIMGGNFVLGKHPLAYFAEDQDKAHLQQVLASVIPWLSSTQGFSRGIAQILVYALIPRVLEGIESDSTPALDSKDWYLRVTYGFLHQNKEMGRLREKQTKFFNEYIIDNCTKVEFLMSFPVDDANESNPTHVIEAMKDSLRQTFGDAHANDVPVWKQIDQWTAEFELPEDSEHVDDSASTIQRKIIPLDSLNLALEDLREQRLTNTVGTHKQPLIVCASLVDKIPNLGGLARTSEIFAAQSLVVPDLSVTKMDNFKSLSVGAADWIDIEEVNEANLLAWLLKKKSQGFWIVGLEQTSSSLPIQEVKMPHKQPTVLLLGKEKEGIPVQFLHTVDQCIEIPQFGIIRSLNVHVSGAIAIWEFTRQTRL